MTEQSYLQVDGNGDIVSYSGPDGVKVYQAAVLASALRLLDRGIKPGRYWTKKAAINKASEILGRPFKQRECLLAADLLTEWANKQKMSLPVVRSRI